MVDIVDSIFNVIKENERDNENNVKVVVEIIEEDSFVDVDKQRDFEH